MSNEQETKIAKVVSIDKLEPGAVIALKDWHIASTSADGTIHLVNLEVDETMEENFEIPYQIQPGAWRVTPKTGLQRVTLSENAYYKTETSEKLEKIFKTFKEKLHVYDFLEIKNKCRKVLLGSIPGVGKSSLLNNFCKHLLNEQNACVLYIDNENVDYEIVQKMFKKSKENVVDFIVLIIEDFGGSDLENRRHNIDSTLLNFLDGQSGVFKIPTLVVATTNYLDLLADNVTNRPGRFDIVMEVEPPKDNECIKLVEDFMKQSLSKEDKESIIGKGFTPAYLKECVIRHMLDDIPFSEAVKQLQKQRELSANKTHKLGRNPRSMGFDPEDYE